jgi:hypothetical protein
MKLARLPDRTPVKITFLASPSLAKSLALYAQYYEEVYRQTESISELMPYALETFLESDRGFVKFRRDAAPNHGSAANRRRIPLSSETSSTLG